MLTTLLFSIICAFSHTAALSSETRPTAPDTTKYYIIDNVRIKDSDFNGSQLVGQKIVVYTVDTLKTTSDNDNLTVRPLGDKVVIVHIVRTEKGMEQPTVVNLQKGDPLYIVDGVVASAEEINDIQTIKSMSVLYGNKAVEQYGQAAKYGAVIIQTKKATKKPE